MALTYKPEVIDGLELSNWDRLFLKKLHAGGVTCVHACCALWENARETLSKVGEWYRFFEENDDLVMQVKTPEDLYIASQENKIGVVLGTQNASPIEDELSLVHVFNELGIKIMQLTYNNQNLIGSSCYEDNDPGLSRYGKLVVEEMNKAGMIIDLSHVGERTSMEAITHSSRPVAITHANPEWIYSSPRNKSKEILTLLQEHNGMIGLCAYPHLINGEHTTLDEFTEMILRTVDFMGVEQVGLGTDLTLNMSEEFLQWMRMGRWTHQFDYGAGSSKQPGWPNWPEWFQSPADFPNIIEGLYRKGMKEEEIHAVMGGNWKRFFEHGFTPLREE